jgi:hypothetical protein
MGPEMPAMGTMRTLGELPGWLRLVGVVVFAVLAVLHLRHSREAPGRQRFWHAGHAGMAAAMVAMYWPVARPLISRGVGATVFLTAAAVFLALAARGATAGTTPGRRLFALWWATAAVDMAAMAYMYTMTPRTRLITDALVVYFVIQAGAWARAQRAARAPASPLLQPAGAHVDRDPTKSWSIWAPKLRASQAGTSLAMAATLLLM